MFLEPPTVKTAGITSLTDDRGLRPPSSETLASGEQQILTSLP